MAQFLPILAATAMTEELFSNSEQVNDSFNHLASCGEDPDCCNWEGVVCHNQTRNVLQLKLASPHRFHVGFEQASSNNYWRLSGELNPALLELEQLQVLDLSYNDFKGIQIPTFLGSLKELKYLGLSSSNFGGEIPYQLGNLSKLVFLDISRGDHINAILRSRGLDWLKGMPSLSYLNLDMVDLSKTGVSWEQTLNHCTSLTELHLHSCGLPRLVTYLNLTSLRILDVGSNSIGKFPKWIANLSNLESLDLSYNKLPGYLPDCLSRLPPMLKYLDLNVNLIGEIHTSIGNMTFLVSISLLGNKITGEVPETIGNMSSLSSLDMSGNMLTGSIPQSIARLANSLLSLDLARNQLAGRLLTEIGRMSSLNQLVLYSNNLSGHIPVTIGNLTSLQLLWLFENKLNGSIPETIGNMINRVDFDLSDNKISSQVPKVVGNLLNLRRLSLRSNLLVGTLVDEHFQQLYLLRWLDLSANQLMCNITNDWIPPFNLTRLRLSSCRVGPQFPLWLKTQESLEWLELFNASLEGTLPIWFWDMNLQFLDSLNRSHNALVGQLPKSWTFPTTYNIDLSFNNFSGSVPLAGNNTPVLDISNNDFSGSLPGYLNGIFLASENKINGTIPASICQTNAIFLLDLSNNHLTGGIPPSIGNCSSLAKLDLSDNFLSGGMPWSLGKLGDLRSLRINKNMLSGNVPLDMRNCSNLEIVDLGENNLAGEILPIIPMINLRVLRLHKNNFTGVIPSTISKMKHLQLLDVGQNCLKVPIPEFEGIMKYPYANRKFDSSYSDYYKDKMTIIVKGLEFEYSSILYLVTGLDLSSNYFEGELPEELMRLSGLMFLNISHNRLTGTIPMSIGALEQLESLDLSNNQLNGEISTCLMGLTFLSKLNLSNNQLWGRVPSGKQLDTFNASSFANNPDLCGPPLVKQCPENIETLSYGSTKGEDEMFDRWFWVVPIFGFAFGFGGFYVFLIFEANVRASYFQFFYTIIDKLTTSFVRRI